MRGRAMVSVLLATVAAACGGRAPPGTGEFRGNRITAEEIQEINAQNAYDMIRWLRPQWLQVSNPASVPIVVYVDGIRSGGVEYLRLIQATSVERADYLNGSEASARYGLNHSGGAILIRLRRTPPG